MLTLPKIWIVDDDPCFRILFETQIKQCCREANIEFYSDGRWAMDALRRRVNKPLKEDLPNLIFLDVNMPILNAHRFLDEWRSELLLFESNIQIVVVSANVNQLDSLHYNHNIVTSTLTKPIVSQDLESVLKANQMV